VNGRVKLLFEGSDNMDPKECFEMDRGSVARYFYWFTILGILAVGVWIFGIGLGLAILYAVTFGPWLSRAQAAALRYWLDGFTLRIDCGVFFLKRKSIPLDRVTDVVLNQGPLLRFFNIWRLDIQTAGTGAQGTAEGHLYGIVNPESVRDRLIAARDQAVGAKSVHGV
jgi:membrane protein YdbS with pleckstrin-like domain